MTNALPAHHANKNFWRNVWQLALPISIQSMMFSLLGLIDIFMVSHLGETEVAAVGMGNRVFFFNLMLTVALGSGMSILSAQYIGAHNMEGIRRTLVQAIVAALVLTLPFVVGYMWVPEQVMATISSDEKLIVLGVDYLLITAPSFICTAIVVPLEAMLRANSDAKTPTRIGMIAIVFNVIFNYILIYGKLGFPEMGVAGSAWGTTLSRLIQTLIIIYFVVKLRPHLKPTKVDVVACKELRVWRKYIGIFTPMLIQDGLWSLGLICYNLMYAKMGVVELAVMSTISSVEGVLISMFIGVAIATSIILGKELGASRFDAAWQLGKQFMLAAPLFALTIGIITYLFSHQIVTLFDKFQGDTQVLAEQILVIAGFALCIRVICLTGIVGVLRSGGDVKATAIINIVGMWCVGMPLTFLAVYILDWPLYMVFFCVLMEEVSKALMTLYRIIKRVWLKNLTI